MLGKGMQQFINSLVLADGWHLQELVSEDAIPIHVVRVPEDIKARFQARRPAVLCTPRSITEILGIDVAVKTPREPEAAEPEAPDPEPEEPEENPDDEDAKRYSMGIICKAIQLMMSLQATYQCQ